MEQNTQMELAKIMRDKHNICAAKFEEALNTERFPKTRYSLQWLIIAYRALMKSTPLSHRVSLEQFNHVVEKANPNETIDITLLEFGILANSVEAVSPHALELSTPEYVSFVNETVGNMKFYNQRVAQLQDDIRLQVDEEFKVKDIANGNLKAVAEA
jgi:hypothetical protein